LNQLGTVSAPPWCLDHWNRIDTSRTRSYHAQLRSCATTAHGARSRCEEALLVVIDDEEKS